MSLREPWRAELLEELSRRELATPLLLTGPPGAGKTTVLSALASRWRGAVRLDLFGAASTAERFVAAAATALEPHADVSPLRPAATSGREAAGRAVHDVLEALASLRAPLLIDEPTEIRSLAYFEGLRDVATAFGEALTRRSAPTVLASSYGFLCGRLWPAWDRVALGPLPGDEDLLRVTFGWPRYRALLPDARGWVDAMSPGGALETVCRQTYEILLLRSRGYGITKALLAIVAEHQPLTMTEAVGHLGRTTGAVRDYLEWLRLVDAVTVERKRYALTDGLLRLWIRLHGQGHVPSRAQIEAAYADALRSERPAAPAIEAPRRRQDSLVEID